MQIVACNKPLRLAHVCGRHLRQAVIGERGIFPRNADGLGSNGELNGGVLCEHIVARAFRLGIESDIYRVAVRVLYGQSFRNCRSEQSVLVAAVHIAAYGEVCFGNKRARFGNGAVINAAELCAVRLRKSERCGAYREFLRCAFCRKRVVGVALFYLRLGNGCGVRTRIDRFAVRNVARVGDKGVKVYALAAYKVRRGGKGARLSVVSQTLVAVKRYGNRLCGDGIDYFKRGEFADGVVARAFRFRIERHGYRICAGVFDFAAFGKACVKHAVDIFSAHAARYRHILFGEEGSCFGGRAVVRTRESFLCRLRYIKRCGCDGEIGGKLAAHKFVFLFKACRNAHGDGVAARVDRVAARQRAARVGGHFIDERAFFYLLSDLRAVGKDGSGQLRHAVIGSRSVVPARDRQFERALFHGQRGGESVARGERIVRVFHVLYRVSHGVSSGSERVFVSHGRDRPAAVRHGKGERVGESEGTVRLGGVEGDKVALIESARLRRGAFSIERAQFGILARRDGHGRGRYGGGYRARALCHDVILVDFVIRRQRYVKGILARIHHRIAALRGDDKLGLLIAHRSIAVRKVVTRNGYRLARVSRRREGQALELQLLLSDFEFARCFAREVARIFRIACGYGIFARIDNGCSAVHDHRKLAREVVFAALNDRRDSYRAARIDQVALRNRYFGVCKVVAVNGYGVFAVRAAEAEIVIKITLICCDGHRVSARVGNGSAFHTGNAYCKIVRVVADK